MSLDTQKFGITQYWLSTALSCIPNTPQIFAKKNLSCARKNFLAGKNQLQAIKSWLTCAEIIQLNRSDADLTRIGKLMAAEDSRAERAWTWWLFHLHLCASDDSWPYSSFFRLFDSDGRKWMTVDEIVKDLTDHIQQNGQQVNETSISTYYAGIEQTFRPGWPIYALGLIERRNLSGEAGQRLRRCLANPADIVIAYGTLLFQKRLFPGQQSIEAKQLLSRGVGKSLGISDFEYREAMMRIHQHQDFSNFLQYKRVANLDSVQFLDTNLHAVRTHGYRGGEVRWP